MRRILAGGLAAVFVLLGSLPVSADSYTWGYGFQRDRATDAPVAADAVDVPNLGANTALPFVVPLPGQSQSSPVIVGDTWYEWTYWDNGQKGALWTGHLDQQTGTSTPGTPVTLPGQTGPVVTALPGERFNDPSDAAISPDGTWVAFGAGKRLYWWPTRTPSGGAFTRIEGPSNTSANSTSPTFVPDSFSPGGWDICDGNWNGAFECFDVGAKGLLGQNPVAQYLVTMTTLADGDGYTAITSSAAYGGPLNDLYFGVASAHDPRVVALNPQSGDFYAMDGGGRVAAPIWAAVALEGSDVYATDVTGTPYRFDAASGNLVAYQPFLNEGTNIVSPAVDGQYLYLVVAAAHLIVRLDRYKLKLANLAPVSVSDVTQASALTVVRDAGAPTEVFYAAQNGGVSIAVPGAPGVFAGGGDQTNLYRIAGWPGAPAGGAYNWTAAVVDGDDVMLWSDGATAAWQNTGAPMAAAPGGFGGVNGGIQIYRLLPRLTALVSPVPAVAGQGTAWLTVLAAHGGQVSATGQAWDQINLQADSSTTLPPCPDSWTGGTSGNYGMFPGAPLGPPNGCGPLGDQVGTLAQWAQSYGSGQNPAFAGLLPKDWQAAGVGYRVLQAALTVPSEAGVFPITVTETMPDGNTSKVQVWLTTTCPAGWGADSTGKCDVNVQPAPNPWVGQNPQNGPPPDDGCSPDMVPGQNGWTQQDYDLLCKPLAPWLTNQNIIDCYGSWWNWVTHQYVKQSCVMPGYGSYVGNGS